MDDKKEREQLKLRMFFDPDRWGWGDYLIKLTKKN